MSRVVVEVRENHNLVKVALLVALYDTRWTVLQDSVDSDHWHPARRFHMVLDYLYRRKQLC